MIRIVGMFGMAVALVGAAGAVAESTGGERIGNPDYVGKGRFDRNMKVEFRIYHKGGRDHVYFQAMNVKFICADNTEKRGDLVPLRTQLEGNEFERVSWGNSHGEAVYWFRGKLIDNGRRAMGFVRATFNPIQQEEDAGLPECTTFGRRSWIAKRVKSR